MTRKQQARKEAVEKLDALNRGDSEAAHSEADEALLTCLREIGCEDVALAWEQARERVGFWYA